MWPFGNSRCDEELILSIDALRTAVRDLILRVDALNQTVPRTIGADIAKIAARTPTLDKSDVGAVQELTESLRELSEYIAKSPNSAIHKWIVTVTQREETRNNIERELMKRWQVQVDDLKREIEELRAAPVVYQYPPGKLNEMKSAMEAAGYKT